MQALQVLEELLVDLKAEMARSGRRGDARSPYYRIDAVILERALELSLELSEPEPARIKLTPKQRELLLGLFKGSALGSVLGTVRGAGARSHQVDDQATRTAELMPKERRSAQVLARHRYIELSTNCREARLTPLGVEAAQRLTFRI
jgi:hypothetical protein